MENVFTDSNLIEQAIKKESSIDFKMVTFTLAGNDPSAGTGTWTYLGPGTVIDWGLLKDDHDLIHKAAL